MPQKPWVDKLRAPRQYQQGYTEFYKLKFFLTPDVLIPRPETELLVDGVIEFAREVSSSRKRGSGPDSLLQGNDTTAILDVGTGSGCIAISVAKNLPQAKVFALDVSPEALKVAEKNAKFHKVQNKVLFLQSDLLQSLIQGKAAKVPDIIVANLPYIPEARLMLIDPMVRDFEPKVALDGGSDGFDLYRKLFSQMKENSFFPKVLICEIDEKQGETALAEAKRFFPNAKSEVKKDFYGADRILKVVFLHNS